VEAGRTAVIVDPPRQGLSAEVVTALERGRCAHLLYVSCAPDTLARDVKRLAAAGFALGQCRVFDMFPRTSHFETVARLDARTPA
jgi:tRNA/tmRNA/rRNA uracil-C5-methylase (TrmA/RlmC/RlmD family)